MKINVETVDVEVKKTEKQKVYFIELTQDEANVVRYYLGATWRGEFSERFAHSEDRTAFLTQLMNSLK